MVCSTTTATGVVVSEYGRAGPVTPGSFEFGQPTEAESGRRRRLGSEERG